MPRSAARKFADFTVPYLADREAPCKGGGQVEGVLGGIILLMQRIGQCIANILVYHLACSIDRPIYEFVLGRR
jgi:hypothetical protein